MDKIKNAFKFDFSKENVLRFIRNSLLVILGTSILALATAVFVIPFDLVTGGLSGVGIILAKIVPVEWLTVDMWVTILTWVFFFIGLFLLGRNFAFQTLIATIVYPLALTLFTKLVSPDVLNGFLDLQSARYANYSQISLVLASIFGGALTGVGCAITFIGGGSTGGVDVVSFLLCKYLFKKVKTSKMIFIVDALIIFAGAFILKDMIVTLLGVVTAFITALVIDKVFLGGSQAFIAFIVSDKFEEINNAIITKLDRTTTIVDALGGYSKEGKQLIMVSFSIREYATLQNIINQIDKYAFMTISRAHEINGEGWTRPNSPSKKDTPEVINENKEENK